MRLYYADVIHLATLQTLRHTPTHTKAKKKYLASTKIVEIGYRQKVLFSSDKKCVVSRVQQKGT